MTLPSGTLTFVFTDIEGSTKLLTALGTDRFHEVLSVHTQTLRRAFADGGTEVRIEGDALFVVFASAAKAIRAAAAAQRGLAATTFPHDAVVRVRMGMHTGDATPASREAGADYVGIDVHRAARIAAVAHGGQVLVSAATALLARGDLGEGIALRDLGEHRLKDLAQPERIYQLVIDGSPADFPPLRSLEGIPNNLPTQVSTFIGREKEIAEGLRLLHGARLLTLTGPGGTGKTRLSLQLAAEAAEWFPDGTYWVPLAPITDPELVPSTIAHSLGVQVSGKEAPLDRVREHVRNKRMLLVMDNFEQILPAVTDVSALLGSSPELRVLASSRAPLRISGEQEYPVPPLELPDPERLPALEVLAQSDAVRLFVERATAVKPDFRVTAENAAAVAEICNRLDGLPLAIELAAARVKLLSPQAMAPRLKGLDLLASTSLERTDRQRTLRGAIGWSFDLLDQGMQRLFARCAVFVGGAALEQVEAVCGPAAEIGREVLHALGELVDQSLMRQVDAYGEPRFRMLVTIREYALERLAASGEGDELRRRHGEAYLAVAEAAAPNLQGNDQKRWLDLVEREHDNLRAALEWAISGRRVEEASRLVSALWRFWQSRGYLREGRAWAERVLALPGAAPATRLRALDAAGGLVYWMADMDVAARHYREQYDLAASIGDRAEQAQAAYNLAFTKIVPGVDTEGARALLEESIATFRVLGDRAAIARAAWALGSTYGFRPGYHPTREESLLARGFMEEALEQHRALGNRFDVAWDLHGSGLIALNLGEDDGAERAWHEAVEIFRSGDDWSGLVLMFSNLAELAKRRGDLQRHDTLVGAWSALAERTGVGIATMWGPGMGRSMPSDIPAERQPAVERGRAMTTQAALAFALETSPATTR
jgi:predicted ATPase/class 3 adenylate cyclase